MNPRVTGVNPDNNESITYEVEDTPAAINRARRLLTEEDHTDVTVED